MAPQIQRDTVSVGRGRLLAVVAVLAVLLTWRPGSAQYGGGGGGTPVTVEFSASEYFVLETGGDAVITVKLSAAADKTVTVKAATSNGTATTGTDYEAVSKTLTFDPGVTE